MTLLHDPVVEVGFFRRFVRIYLEKRQPPHPGWPKAPRWACAQIAWHQAHNARDCGCS